VVNRLFLAVTIPIEVSSALIATLPRLPGRPVPPANLHLTVRFLGEIDEVTSERLTASLDQAELGGAFRIVLGEMGAFPRPARASVLWVAIVRGKSELESLNAVVEEACEDAGLEPSDRPYSPHLTVSRIRPDVDVRKLLLSYRPEPIQWQVSDLVLFRSHLGRGGAVYEPLERFPL
jgi:2'-5' RNA ligase